MMRPEKTKQVQPVVSLTPALPVRARESRGRTRCYLTRNKISVSDEDFEVISGVYRSLVSMKFKTIEKGVVQRWFCELCTSPKYYEDLQSCGWSSKVTWKRYVSHLLQNCILADPHCRDKRILVLKGNLKFNILFEISKKYQILMKNSIQSRRTEETQAKDLEKWDKNFAMIKDAQQLVELSDSTSRKAWILRCKTL